MNPVPESMWAIRIYSEHKRYGDACSLRSVTLSEPCPVVPTLHCLPFGLNPYCGDL